MVTNKEDKIKQTTIYDISQKAGVSIATVSRVLNDNPKVREKTRAKVLKVMDELNYEPNIFARGLGIGSMKTIGILCADVADIYLANAVSYLERELRTNGFNSILNCTGYEYEAKVKGMKSLLAHKVDAIVTVGSHYIEANDKKNGYIREASESAPIMMLNGYLNHNNIYCSLSDDYTAYKEATDYLISLGKEKILFLHGEETYSQKRKFKGYRDALKLSGQEVNPKLIVKASGRIMEIKNELETVLLDRFPAGADIDAILATSDEHAMAALKYCNQTNLSVPEKVSIIGCNNSVISICSQPELTSIDNMCENLCINVVGNLMSVLNRQKTPQKTMVSCELIKRSTTK